ncbi:hypothetical protein V2A60_010022 [Cordyceps javanica]
MSISKGLVLLLTSQALALPREVLQAQEAPGGLIHLPLAPVTPVTDEGAKSVARRQIFSGVDQYQYTTDAAMGVVVEIGSPPQKVIVEPDTGSRDLWVLDLQPGQKREEPASTFFDRSGSSSLKALGNTRMVSFASERFETDLYSDNVSFGGQSLGDVTVGLADLSKPNTKLARHTGVLGLAPPDLLSDPDAAKGSLLQGMLDQKSIKSKAFGLGLRKRGQGGLTFGGYDASKFSGRLEKLEIQDNGRGRYAFNLKSVSFKSSKAQDPVELYTKTETGRPLRMGTDSGSVAVYISKGTAAAQEFVAKTGAVIEDNKYVFGCDVVDSGASLEFQISDATVVSMPLADIVLSKSEDGKTCTMRMAAENRMPDPVWVGQHFFRRAYVVHDYDNGFIRDLWYKGSITTWIIIRAP